MEDAYKGREKLHGFHHRQGAVLELDGYSCAPMNPDHFWCPEISYSVPRDTIHATREAAVTEARSWIASMRVMLDKAERKL